MNLFYSITLYLWDFIFSIIDKNEIKTLRIVCKDFRNISTKYWIKNIHKSPKTLFETLLKNLINNNNLLLLLSCEYLEIVKLLVENSANINEKKMLYIWLKDIIK